MYRSRRVATIVVARAASTRLPGKMLLPFGSGSVLSTALERLRHSQLSDEIVLATTTGAEDDALAAEARRVGVPVVRGSAADVVGRMSMAVAALEQRPEVVIRACADNPLVMPAVVDAGVRELVDSGADVLTPFEHATLPFGYGLVSLTRECLERIDAEARAPVYREHVENYCFEHPGDFKIRYQIAPPELDYPELCLTLDYSVDYARLSRYEHRLRKVPLGDQARALVEHLRSARVWIDGISAGSPVGHDLVLLTRASADTVRASRGLVVVDVASSAGAERFVLRYAGPNTEPLFVDRRARRPGDTPESFLAYAAPLVLPTLLAAPARPAELREGPAPAAAKQAVRARRPGFGSAQDALFPPRVVLDRSAQFTRPRLFERVIDELERQPSTELLLHAGEPDAVVERVADRLGPARVSRGSAHPDPFAVVRVDGRGTLRTGQQQGALEGATLESFWASSAARRARAEALNGVAA